MNLNERINQLVAENEQLKTELATANSMHVDAVRFIWEERGFGSCAEMAEKFDALVPEVELSGSTSIYQQASAWSCVYDFVRKFVPEFSMMEGTGKEKVISAIDGLIKRNRELSNLINPHHLAAHDAEVGAKAIEIASVEHARHFGNSHFGRWLRDYASQLRAKAGA